MDWEQQVAQLWAGDVDAPDFMDRAAALAAACPSGDGSDDLDDAVRAFLALCLADVGREREALGIALGALAPHLPRYQRSLGAYAAELAR